MAHEEKIKIITSGENNEYIQAWFYCPGCKNHHAYTLKSPGFVPWTFNNNLEKPTFTPSLLCNKDYPESRCHLFITNGVIDFCDDCFHELKGQKGVEIPPLQWT